MVCVFVKPSCLAGGGLLRAAEIVHFCCGVCVIFFGGGNLHTRVLTLTQRHLDRSQSPGVLAGSPMTVGFFFAWLAGDGQRRRESGGFGWLADECGFFFPDSPTTVGGVGCVARLADSPQSLSHPLIKNGLNEDSNLRPLGYEPNTLTTTPFSLD